MPGMRGTDHRNHLFLQKGGIAMSDFRLYEISELLEAALAQCREYAEKDEGVIPDDWAKFLDEIEMERDKKVLDVGRYIKTIRAKAEAIKAEKQSLAGRQSSLEHEAERLEGYIAHNIKPGERVQDNNTVLSWRRSTMVVIDNPDNVPDEYCKIERIPQKTAIKEALKSGEVFGARIVENINLQIK
jgi:hypothetical protein